MPYSASGYNVTVSGGMLAKGDERRGVRGEPVVVAVGRSPFRCGPAREGGEVYGIRPAEPRLQVRPPVVHAR